MSDLIERLRKTAAARVLGASEPTSGAISMTMQSFMFERAKVDKLRSSYDTNADVLYVTNGVPQATHGREDQSGVLWKYNAAGSVTSVVIYDVKDRSHGAIKDLAASIAVAMMLPKRDVLAAVSGALKGVR